MGSSYMFKIYLKKGSVKKTDQSSIQAAPYQSQDKFLPTSFVIIYIFYNT